MPKVKFLVSIHFNMLDSFSGVKVEKRSHEPDSWEFECWKVILQTNFHFVMWSCDYDLTYHRRMSGRHVTKMVNGCIIVIILN